LREGFAFYREVAKSAAAFDHPLREASRVLDFGCGWGRIIRFFLKCVRSDNLIGADVNPAMIEICRETNRYCRFVVSPAQPPLDMDCGSFDAIYAFSVFSHLASDTADRWIEEFARLLKRGGILVVTTQPRHFIEFCRHWRTHAPQRQWHELLAKAFPDAEEAYARYDAGEYLYVPTGGGGVLDAAFYGEAMVPPQYVRKHWAKHLAVLDFISDGARCPQAMIVMQKLGA
jgi:ubiquinone/menaquinone biosynthesis C-methylase UbiE